MDEGTTHVSDLTVSTTATEPSGCKMKQPQSVQYQFNNEVCHGNKRCVSLEDTIKAFPQVQRKTADHNDCNFEPLPITQMSEITQVSPNSMFRSIHESTAPNEIMRAIGKMDLFPWGDDNHTAVVSATNTQLTVEEPIEKVSGIENVTSFDVHLAYLQLMLLKTSRILFWRRIKKLKWN